MIARLEEANARAYERFASKVARPDKPLSDPLHEAEGHPSDDLETPFNSFRPAVAGDRPSHGTPTRRFFGLLLAAFIGVAALIWALSYSDAVKQLIAGWASQSASSSSQTLVKPEFPAQASSPNAQVDRAKVANPRTGSQTQTAPEGVAPITAVQAGELQTMARDLATVRQGIEQLKASHEQLARDNGKIAEQFKANQEQAARDYAKIAEQVEASQEQMARVIAKASKRNLRPKTSAPTSAPPPPPVR